MRRLSRLLVLVVAAAVGTAPLADCLPPESMTASEMACCVALDHDCNAAGMETTCCPTGSRDTNQAPVSQALASLTGKMQPAPVPASAPAAWTLLTVGTSTVNSAFEAFNREMLKLPERPTYLLVSAFLI